ncbi:MAG TPA: hypothetical protein VGS22_02735 [Thermoanaerobaculia bacterium]|jgi:hypothetical protein|nr:hypothetical protein [Thermoanaerobaculia bacterium]
MSEGEIHRARKLLAALIHLSNKSRQEIDELLDNCRGQTSQLLTGRIAMRYEHILRVLDAIHIPPGDFFRTLFPKPGDRGGLAEGPVLARYIDALDEAGVPVPPLEPQPAPLLIDPADLERHVRAAMTEALAALDRAPKAEQRAEPEGKAAAPKAKKVPAAKRKAGGAGRAKKS